MGLSKCFCFCQGDHPFLYLLFLERKKVSYSVMSDSLQHHGLCSPWNSLDQNTGVGSLSLFQGIFPTQGSFFFFFLVPFMSTYQIQFYPSDIIKAKASWKLSLISKGIFLIALTSTLWMVYQSTCHSLWQLHVSLSLSSPRYWTDWRLIPLALRPWYCHSKQ